jgi:hypothetical protein
VFCAGCATRPAIVDAVSGQPVADAQIQRIAPGQVLVTAPGYIEWAGPEGQPAQLMPLSGSRATLPRPYGLPLPPPAPIVRPPCGGCPGTKAR